MSQTVQMSSFIGSKAHLSNLASHQIPTDFTPNDLGPTNPICETSTTSFGKPHKPIPSQCLWPLFSLWSISAVRRHSSGRLLSVSYRLIPWPLKVWLPYEAWSTLSPSLNLGMLIEDLVQWGHDLLQSADANFVMSVVVVRWFSFLFPLLPLLLLVFFFNMVNPSLGRQVDVIWINTSQEDFYVFLLVNYFSIWLLIKVHI